MKSILSRLVILTAFFVIATAGTPKETKQIVGNYRFLKQMTNGQLTTDAVTKTRTMTFKDDNTFTGNITRNGNETLFIQGLFFVENDSMMIMHRNTLKGNQYKIAFAYNYKISGDTLNLRGYWTQNPTNNQPMLLKNYIDEYWIKVSKK